MECFIHGQYLKYKWLSQDLAPVRQRDLQIKVLKCNTYMRSVSFLGCRKTSKNIQELPEQISAISITLQCSLSSVRSHKSV